MGYGEHGQSSGQGSQSQLNALALFPSHGQIQDLSEFQRRVAQSFALQGPFMLKLLGDVVQADDSADVLSFPEFMEQLLKSSSDKKYMWRQQYAQVLNEPIVQFPADSADSTEFTDYQQSHVSSEAGEEVNMVVLKLVFCCYWDS